MTRSRTKTNGQTRPTAATTRATTAVPTTAGTDELTGVWNRPGFVAAATPLFVSCQRRGTPVALAYFDFHTNAAAVPDAAGVDRVLITMAGLMRRAFRASDVIGRVDTLRFAVLLTDCTDDALAAVDGVRALTDDATSPPQLTLTAGMVHGVPGESLEDLMRAADVRTSGLKNDDDR